MLILSLYRPSVGVRKIDDHDLLLIYSCCHILIDSTNVNYNNQLDWSLSPSLPFFIPFPSHAQHPSSLVSYCSHLPRGGLHIWGFRDNRSAVDVQAIERILLVWTICSFSTGAVGPPKRFQPYRAPPTTVPRVNWTTINYMIWRSSATERMIGIEEWRRPKEFPKGALKIVSSGTMCALSSIAPLTYIVQLEWLTSTPWPNSSLSSFSTPSSVIRDGTQCRQGGMRSTSYHCSMRGDCSTNWNRCPIDAGKTTGSTFQWCARPFDDSFAICSPSQTSLIIDPVSLLHTSRGPRVTVRVFRKDDEVNESGGSEGS